MVIKDRISELERELIQKNLYYKDFKDCITELQSELTLERIKTLLREKKELEGLL
jgi:hypothetical protein